MMFASFNQGMNRAKANQDLLSVAVNLAQTRIEEYKLNGRGQPNVDVTENPVQDYAQFTRRTVVVPRAVNSNLKRITVTVTWGNQRSYVLETLL
ncbi:MAG: hypothetical protein JW795_10910 [Chitinivibrionales bacterium]|nr:hypothetical protein [Chitinivibrionales bacterium]